VPAHLRETRFPGCLSEAAATIRRTMDDEDVQRAVDVLASLEAVWRLDPAPPSPPRLPGTLMVKALAVSGLTPSVAAVARGRFELELLHDGEALDDADYAREVEALDGLEDLGA
jgi:hypothetical protein